MNARTAAEAAPVERVRQRYFRPGARERGLEILARELENSDECIAIAQRIASLLHEHRASRRGAKTALKAN